MEIVDEFTPIQIGPYTPLLPPATPQPLRSRAPGSPPSVLHSSSSIVDPIVVPDLPLDEAVKMYANWHKSLVAFQEMKENIDLACQVSLASDMVSCIFSVWSLHVFYIYNTGSGIHLTSIITSTFKHS
jgi:hypothetical protein